MSIKICPTEDELESASEFFCCEEGCIDLGIKFKNSANLEMHLTKTHGLPKTPSNSGKKTNIISTK